MIKSLSIIYPIFNEESRLINIFSDIKSFNKETKDIKKEYIFVDDGSKDKSKMIIKNFIKKNSFFKVSYKIISYKTNRGKGFALKKGVKRSTNKWILTSDADCSVSNFQLIKWLRKKFITKKNKIYFSSRNHPLSKVKKNKTRQFIGLLFRLFILIFFRINISDTQCGFKLYESKIAKKIFNKIKTHGYMHDIEVYIIAKKMMNNIKVLPVNWKHQPDGKINLFKDFIKILVNLIQIKFYKY